MALESDKTSYEEFVLKCGLLLYRKDLNYLGSSRYRDILADCFP
jgi:hypothetical protein